jgi:hypothetical protein
MPLYHVVFDIPVFLHCSETASPSKMFHFARRWIDYSYTALPKCFFCAKMDSQNAFEMTHKKVCHDGTFLFVNGRVTMTSALILTTGIFSFFHGKWAL